MSYPHRITAHKDCNMNSLPDAKNFDEFKKKIGMLPSSSTEEPDYSQYDMLQEELSIEKRESEVGDSLVSLTITFNYNTKSLMFIGS